ncbi:cellulose biosynthesis protein BcsP [Pusillimonas sp. NJUB218]|uniref:cellulose biosynthesis protein BcsP n=1 Tax=Pusillimonas sp. NJUB218 TaxID=2023230 RepID=UPI000F4C77C0|nr:cellulose biosynthesis protein BcsP [Pusillimonas sp. NJUB218]
MSQDTDIQNLFRQFDGQSAKYKEITRDEQNSSARHRWPLIETIKLHQEPVPPARIVEPAFPEHVAEPQVSNTFVTAVATDQAQHASVAPTPAPEPKPERVIPSKTALLRSLTQSPQRLRSQFSPTAALDLSEAQHKPLFQASNKRTEQKTIETPAPSTMAQSAAPTTPSDTAQTPLKKLFGRLASSPQDNAPSDLPLRRG